MTLLLLLTCYLVACNGNSNSDAASTAREMSNKVSIKMKIEGFANDKVKLLGVFADQNFLVDSAQADANGNIVFERDSLYDSGVYFILFPDNKYFQLMLDKDQVFSLEANKEDLVSTMKVSGSVDNELLYKNLVFEQEVTKKFDAVKEKMDKETEGSEAYKQLEKEQDELVQDREAHVQWFADNHPEAFFTVFKIAGQNPQLKKPTLPGGEINTELQVYWYRNEFWDNVDFTDDRLLRTPVYHNKLKRFIKELTPQTADSIIKYADIIVQKSKANKELFKYTANYIALQYQKPKIMGLEAVYVHMIDKYWTYDQAFWSDSSEIKGLRREISYMKPSLIGNIGQDLRAKNENDEYISLYDLKAPIIVLFIYSYECDNCKKETPKLVKFYNEWKNKGVDVFTISIDNDREQWKAYLKKNNMTFHNIYDFERESKYHRKYHVDVTPELYVLNKDRRIIASNIDTDQLPAVIEKERAKNPW